MLFTFLDLDFIYCYILWFDVFLSSFCFIIIMFLFIGATFHGFQGLPLALCLPLVVFGGPYDTWIETAVNDIQEKAMASFLYSVPFSLIDSFILAAWI